MHLRCLALPRENAHVETNGCFKRLGSMLLAMAVCLQNENTLLPTAVWTQHHMQAAQYMVTS